MVVDVEAQPLCPPPAEPQRRNNVVNTAAVRCEADRVKTLVVGGVLAADVVVILDGEASDGGRSSGGLGR